MSTITGIYAQPTRLDGDQEVSLAPYLAEIQRQTMIASSSFSDAMFAGLSGDNGWENRHFVWQSIQSGLFAAIIVARVVSAPERKPRKSAPESAREAYELGVNRAQRLSSLLDVRDDSALRRMVRIRNSIEHVDERIDLEIVNGANSLLDFNLAQPMFNVPPKDSGAAVLRVFSPAAGILRFGPAQWVDVLELDVELVRLHCVSGGELDVAWSNAGYQAKHPLMGLPMTERSPESSRAALEWWQEQRALLGAPLGRHLDLHLLDVPLPPFIERLRGSSRGGGGTNSTRGGK